MTHNHKTHKAHTVNPDLEALEKDLTEDALLVEGILTVDGSLPSDNEEQTPPMGSSKKSTALDQYYALARKDAFLKPAEERKLIYAFQVHHSFEARDRLITSHMRLVIKVAQRYQRKNIDLEDLISEGIFGLIRALEKFDLRRSSRFGTYAVWWIRSYIVQYMLTHWSIVRPASLSAQKKLFFHFQDKKRKALEGDEQNRFLDRDQTKKMSEDYGVTQQAIQNLDQRLSLGQVSLDSSLDEENSSLANLIVDDTAPGLEESVSQQEIHNWQQKILGDILEKMSPREQSILKNRWLNQEKRTLQDLADDYHVSRERIRQIETRAFEKIRTLLEEKKISAKDLLATA